MRFIQSYKNTISISCSLHILCLLFINVYTREVKVFKNSKVHIILKFIVKFFNFFKICFYKFNTNVYLLVEIEYIFKVM